jgi:hypothetical protein
MQRGRPGTDRDGPADADQLGHSFFELKDLFSLRKLSGLENGSYGGDIFVIDRGPGMGNNLH